MFKFSGYIPPAQGSLSIEALQLSFLNAHAASFSKIEAVFFLMNSLCGLKANGPFSAKSRPGTLWKLKFETNFSKTKAVFFLMNSLCGLKANGPFSAKSWPGTLRKLKFAILSLQIILWQFDGLGNQNLQNESRIFFDEFFMRLKGKQAVFRQILAGDPLEAQICHFELANHHFEAQICHFEPKMKHFEAKMKHFDPKPLENAGFGP